MWDGKKENGNKVDDGVYFYVIKPVGTDGNTITPKSGKLDRQRYRDKIATS